MTRRSSQRSRGKRPSGSGGNGVTLAAVTLIAIQLLLMGDLLAHSYFRQDDYSYLYRGLDSGFGWEYLMWEDAGHLQPLGMALAWFWPGSRCTTGR